MHSNNRLKKKQAEQLEKMRQELENRQRLWLSLVAFSSRMQVWVARFKDEQIRRQHLSLQTEASRKIQETWRAHHSRVKARKWRKDMAIVIRYELLCTGILIV